MQSPSSRGNLGKRPSRAAVALLCLFHLMLALAPHGDWVLCIEPDSRWFIEPAIEGQCSVPREGLAVAVPQDRSDPGGITVGHCGSCTDLAFRPLGLFNPSPFRAHVLTPAPRLETVLSEAVPPPPPSAARCSPVSAPSAALQFRVTVTFLV